MTDQELEQEIQAKGLNAPRITPDDIEAAIASEFYLTGSDAARVSRDLFLMSDDIRTRLDILTVCVLVLKNGFTVVGKASPVSPDNYNADIGRKVARQDAINQIWPLLGYSLLNDLLRTSAKTV